MIGVPAAFEPRAAVGYMLVSALEVAALCGVGESLRTEIDVAAAALQGLAAAWGPDAPEDSLAKSLARKLHGTVPQIMGAGLTAPIANRWKTQINENAKAPGVLLRAARTGPQRARRLGRRAQLGRFSAVFLDDSDLHPRVRERIDLTRQADPRARDRRRAGRQRRGVAHRAARLAGAAR